jgi:hypothetical protein
MKRPPDKRDQPPSRPVTFRAAENLGAFELAQLWADRTAWPIDERTQYDTRQRGETTARRGSSGAVVRHLPRLTWIALRPGVLGEVPVRVGRVIPFRRMSSETSPPSSGAVQRASQSAPSGVVTPFVRCVCGLASALSEDKVHVSSLADASFLPGRALSPVVGCSLVSEADRSSATGCARLVPCHRAIGNRRDRQQCRRRQWSGSDR